jgi:alpha-1,2-mannosyltransferase
MGAGEMGSASAAAFGLMARSTPLPPACGTLAFMIWLMPMPSPLLLFPVVLLRPRSEHI